MSISWGESRSWSQTLPAAPTTATEARWFLREVAEEQDLGIDLYAAALLTTEIAANAARHGSEPFGLRIGLEEEGLRVAVHDHGPGFDPDEALGNGYGLSLVQQLASEWGVERGADETEVWFRLQSPAGT
jgi:anti-sigma regulatory factor (Ser/Thr protein kinase)